MVNKPKNLWLDDKDVERWEKFCLYHFKTKRVLSKIISEAMEQYIENFDRKD
jgi:hypothetical protein